MFSKVTVDTEITIIEKAAPKSNHKIRVTVVEKDDVIDDYKILQSRWQAASGDPVNIFERQELVVLADKLRSQATLDSFCVITQGAKPFQVGKGKPPQTREIVNEKPYVSDSEEDPTFRPLLRGSLIRKYSNLWNGNYWISFGDWLAEPRYSAQYDAPAKIVVRQTGDSLVATLDCSQFIVRDNLYTIVPRRDNLHLHYVLGLLNSRLLNWFYQAVLNPEKGEALAQVKRGHLARLPIPTIDLSDPTDKAHHDKMVELVKQMLRLHEQLSRARTANDKNLLQRQINATDRQIDRLVYELYGLTEDEIQLVEG